MKLRIALATGAVALVAVPMALAGAPVDRATGGGQILFASRGAGNTLAFTAQGTSSDGTGQVQFIDRSGGNGQDQIKEHGTVSCIDAMGNAAKVAGTLRDGDSFNLFVEDNGEGQGATDMIFFDTMADSPDCDFDEPDEDELEALARGNAQVYDAGMSGGNGGGGNGGGEGGNGNNGGGENGNGEEGEEAVLSAVFALL